MNFTNEQKRLQVRRIKNGMMREISRVCPYINRDDMAILESLLDDDIQTIYSDCVKSYTDSGASKIYKNYSERLGVKCVHPEYSLKWGNQLQAETQIYKTSYFVEQYQNNKDFALYVCPILYNYFDKKETKTERRTYHRQMVFVPRAVKVDALLTFKNYAERGNTVNGYELNTEQIVNCYNYCYRKNIGDVITHSGNTGLFLNLLTGKLDALILDYAL